MDEGHGNWFIAKHVRIRDMGDKLSFGKQQSDWEMFANNVNYTHDSSTWIRNEIHDDGVDVTQ